MTLSAPSSQELEFLIDTYLDASRTGITASEGVRRAARAVVLEMSETERQRMLYLARQKEAIALRSLVLWVVQVVALAGVYVGVFYGVLVMQISLLPVILLVVLTGILLVGYDSVRDFLRDSSMAADLK
ncbi:hypothetical protein FGK63_09935 [Ruegeria sediminis]|uniref:DUF2335 domain-containing protein n=1 Tax=Ruegeria sediminis TaxID=2583820 RepID=A0ABY2WZK5_9RHOB|nr:hypothetical protein [Ruegeria sediminis]TMV07775.1 hypothetical protein FGK63_09935 [Ruegeria sediminis]